MIDWCQLNKNAGTKSPFQKFFIKLIKEAKEFFTPCPFNGTYKAMNLSLSQDVISILPKGIYKGEVEILNGNKEMICVLKLNGTVFT